jgi:uncharacterized membrane protein YfcA
MVLANVGGIGGGGIIIPVTMAFFGFSTKESIAICSVLILSGSVVRFIMQIDERHPERDATLIDYNIVIVMMPMVLLGGFLGVLINIALPNVILSACLFLLVTWLAWMSWLSARRIASMESNVQIELAPIRHVAEVNE